MTNSKFVVLNKNLKRTYECFNVISLLQSTYVPKLLRTMQVYAIATLAQYIMTLPQTNSHPQEKKYRYIVLHTCIHAMPEFGQMNKVFYFNMV